METLLYLAVVLVASVVAYSVMGKVPKQKPPTLDEFSLPTAEEGRSIPWIFGTMKIMDPNIIWYGDLEVRTRTKDKVKTRVYRMGIQLECCISPVDALVALDYGGKRCWSVEVTESQQIDINLPDLFGGRDAEGGIDGLFDICMGEPTQAVNDYLQSQLGTPAVGISRLAHHRWPQAKPRREHHVHQAVATDRALHPRRMGRRGVLVS